MKRTSGSLMLLFTALIWGTAFVAQRLGMDYMGPITFQSVRMLLGFATLLPVVLLRRRRQRAAFRSPSPRAALTCGLVLAAAGTLQQIGLTTTPAGKAGFISALYVVLVPVLGLFLGRKTGTRTWIGVALSVLGLYLLSSVGRFSLSAGECCILISALLYALHILVIDRWAPGCDGTALSCLQFLVAGLAALLPGLLLEQPALAQIWRARWALLYTGVLSCAVAYTLQIMGQQRVPPTLASLIMSLESVFSALAGALFLRETMGGRELLGCGLMLLAVVLSQLPGREAQGELQRKKGLG